MKNTLATVRSLQRSLGGILLGVLALPAAAVDLKTGDGSYEKTTGSGPKKIRRK